ncbi:apolipoprotein N-acyltransferase [Malikia sp.]|uniref:apolipoprotein N-acyltransferase n=1 Tax=Malikia sp. TaxID=2070706 RepID=UPI00262E384E|nr:apolipoprotein N-acyltransferase [Malikia sp.]MDD2730030.1 apolipoprotein N-acyltransferase [Malikia sp.]
MRLNPSLAWRAAPAGTGLLLAGLLQAWSLAWPFALLWPQGEPVAGLQILSLALLVPLLHRAATARAAFFRGWIFSTAWLAGTFWWLFVSMHTYGGLPAPLAALAVLALAAALALCYAPAAGLYWRWRAAGLRWRLPVFVALWTLAELARGTVFTGFPWGAGGYAQVDALAPLAPWVGVHGMGAVSAALALLAAEAWQALAGRFGSAGARRRGASVGTVPLAGGLAGAIGLVLLAWPGVAQHWAGWVPIWTRSTGVMSVALLQGNIPQDEKFQPGSGVPLALSWYGQQARAALARGDARLVVAPETAIPLLPQQLGPDWWQPLLQAVARGGAALTLGLPLGSVKQGYTNSALSWTPEARAPLRYDKQHLVPFGEFIPTGFRWFTELMHIPLGDFNRGAPVQPTLDWAGQRIAPNICYEDLFGEELARGFVDPARAPTVLLNLSNIAWFGDTVAIAQHRQISRLRALELQRPMLRATNTGATVAIDHLGRVTHELPRLTRGVLMAEVEGRAGLTPYARWAGRFGLWPLALLCVFALLVAWRRGDLSRP